MNAPSGHIIRGTEEDVLTPSKHATHFKEYSEDGCVFACADSK